MEGPSPQTSQEQGGMHLSSVISLRILAWVSIWLSICAGLWAPSLHAEGTLELQERVINLFENKQGAVVRVLAILPTEEELQGDEATPQYEATPQFLVGTGFIMSKEGHVVTNANIIQSAKAVYIEYQKQSYEAKVVGVDTSTHMGIVKIAADEKDFAFLGISDNLETLKRGSFLLAITCEMGLEPSPSLGILTGYNLYYGDKTLPTTCIRSDIPSDGGEGGAPVFDLNGRFVGMIMASLVDIRSCFILPARAILRVRDDILFAGAVSYGYLGLRIDEESAIYRDQPLLVAEVNPGSPAAKAGLRANDILSSVDGIKLEELGDLRDALFYARPGQFLHFQILREGESLSVPVQVSAFEPQSKDTSSPESPRSLRTENPASALGEGLETSPTKAAEKDRSVLPDHQPRLDAMH